MAGQEREKIGTSKARNVGALDIYYVGGSAFDFVMPAGDGKTKTIRVSKAKVDEFIRKGAVKLTSKRRYDEICSAILPDGSTATHNADGTRKSTEQQVLDKLVDEGYAGVDSNGMPFVRSNAQAGSTGRRSDAPRQPRNRISADTAGAQADVAQSAQKQQGRMSDPDPFGFGDGDEGNGSNGADAQADQGAPSANHGRRTARSAAYKKRQQEREAAAVEAGADPFDGLAGDVVHGAAYGMDGAEPAAQAQPPYGYARGAAGAPSMIDMTSGGAPYGNGAPAPYGEPGYGTGYGESTYAAQDPSFAQQQRRRDPRDANGDGVVDEFDDLVEESKAKSPILILATIIVSALSLFLFVGLYITIHGFLGGNQVSIPFIGGGDAQEQQGNGSGAGGNAAQEGDGAQTPSQQQEKQPALTDRTDFDPEDAVSAYPMASEEQETIAIGLFQAIRTAVNSGDVNGFNQLIALEQIGDRIADSYARHAQDVQGLQQSQADELKTFWKDTFATTQRQHVVDKDLYGSIFGGRIREVRSDPDDQNKMYVVTESIAGDHQRACFVLTSDGTSWAVTDMADADGYVRMVSEGKTSPDGE